MKDLHYYVNQVQVSALLNMADELNCPSDCYEGVLVDNYIIYDAQDIRFENLPARKFIMIQEIYENEWSSATIMTLTNDYRQVERFAIEMGMEREEKEKWNRNTSA